MDYEMLSAMKVEELKTFLRLRGLKVTGRKQELISRAFSAIENEAPVLKTAEEVEGQIQDEYKKKLFVDGTNIPDPFKLETGWQNEDEGISKWPLVSTFTIIKFLMIGSDVEDLNNYKSSKAYSYFKQGWLGELWYHPLENSSHCLLKGDCRPSQRISDTKHKFWLLLTQEEGKIVKAHCSCMAGMGSSCNHVAAALFRLEAAMRLGLCNPACTTKPCEWLPRRQEVKPCKVEQMDLNRDDFKKRQKQAKKLISTPKRNYNPIAQGGMKRVNFNSIVEALGDQLKNTVLSTAVPKPEIDFFREVLSEEPLVTEQVPSLDDIVQMSSSEIEFLQNLETLKDEKNVSEIERLTRGQSSNVHWFHYRKGVITASRIHEVKTKMTKVEKGSSDVNIWSLNQNIAGLTFVNPNIPALRYGREMENSAAEKLLEVFKLKHKDCIMEECGLFLCQSFPFVGASPDRVLNCSCHGKWSVEIKCPFSISHLSPNDETAILPFMKNDELKQTHGYFSQCQLQMGVLEVKRCIFFVYTAHGYILKEVEFDETFYTRLLMLSKNFYYNHYVKFLFSNCS